MQLLKEYNEKVYVNNPEDVYKELKEIYKEKKEFFIAFYLDSKNKIIAREIISIGTLNSCLVHPREIFKGAILRSANTIITAHNHPSGDSEPSSQDLEINRKLKEAGDLLGIKLLDNLIVCDGNYKSTINAGV